MGTEGKGTSGISGNSPDAGVALPSSGGGRSSTEFAKAVLADAVRKFDADLSQAIETSQRWRTRYPAAFHALTAVSASSPAAARGIAADGLRSALALLRYVHHGSESALSRGSWRKTESSLGAQTIRGGGDAEPALRVPFADGVLEGDALRAQLTDWRDRGIVEQSFAAAVEKVIENPKWLSLPGFQVLVVGAGAELSPYLPLLAWGANVLAVEAPGTEVWQRLTDAAAQGAGTVTFPVAADVPGADVARDFPQVLGWVYANAHKKRRLVAGLYADDARLVEATAAFGVIADDLVANWPDTTLAYLGSPTDCYAVKTDVMAEARRRWNDRGFTAPVQNALRIASRSTLFRPHYHDEVVDYEGNHWGLADAVTAALGPDFVLAKRLQRWRGVRACANGQRISFNVAPASWTRAVADNRALAAILHGIKHFGVEVFAADTARTLMAAKLVADLFDPPAVDTEANPEELFYEGAAHGGLWRLPYEPLSALRVAAAMGAPKLLHRR